MEKKLIINANTIDVVKDLEGTPIDYIDLEYDMHLGGIVPSFELLGLSEIETTKPIIVNLKMKYDTYKVDDEDMSKIAQLLEIAKNFNNVKGIKWSGLTREGRIDIESLKKIIEMKGDLKLFFGRAIDSSRDYKEALEDLEPFINNIENIISSGGAESAIDGLHNLSIASEKFPGQVVACSKISLSNIDEIINDIDQLGGIYISKGVKDDFDVYGSVRKDLVQMAKDKILNVENGSE